MAGLLERRMAGLQEGESGPTCQLIGDASLGSSIWGEWTS